MDDLIDLIGESPRSRDVGSSSSKATTGAAGTSLRPPGIGSSNSFSTRSRDEGASGSTSSRSLDGGSSAGGKAGDIDGTRSRSQDVTSSHARRGKRGGSSPTKEATRVTTSHRLPKGKFAIVSPIPGSNPLANWDTEGAAVLLRKEAPSEPPA